MSDTFTFYSWEVSYFGGKLRSYLRNKNIPFKEIRPTIFGFYGTLKRHTGVAAVPVVKTPEGDWLQDTSAIIDVMEQRFRDRSVVPATPIQRIVAYLFEMWGDEFWIPTGLHTRWCHREENYSFLEKDVADDLLPGWPRFLQKKAVAKVAKQMADYLASTGVVPKQFELLHRWTVQQLDLLDRHFASTSYLLGTRASLGDFGLMGPMYGHLSRDPWPASNLINPRPHLKAWVARMNQTSPALGEFLPDDRLPDTLIPLIRSMLAEMLHYLEGNLDQVRQFMCSNPAANTWPRFIGEIEFPMLDGHFRRPAMPYVLWMHQRMMTALHALPAEDVARIRHWLREQGADRLLDLPVPRLRRSGLGAMLDR